jgi:hypothetical protein
MAVILSVTFIKLRRHGRRSRGLIWFTGETFSSEEIGVYTAGTVAVRAGGVAGVPAVSWVVSRVRYIEQNLEEQRKSL